jgi:hypothetical protein
MTKRQGQRNPGSEKQFITEIHKSSAMGPLKRLLEVLRNEGGVLCAWPDATETSSRCQSEPMENNLPPSTNGRVSLTKDEDNPTTLFFSRALSINE